MPDITLALALDLVLDPTEAGDGAEADTILDFALALDLALVLALVLDPTGAGAEAEEEAGIECARGCFAGFGCITSGLSGHVDLFVPGE